MKRPPDEKTRFGCWFAELLQRQKRMQNAQACLDSTKMPVAARPRGTMTKSGISLAELQPGECGYIGKLIGSAKGRLRLMEMGLTPGTHVKVIRTAAFGGPLDVEVRNYQLSLRRDEAASVWLGDESEL